MLELLYATGLRVSELIHVKIEDLVMDAGFLRTIGKGSKERIVPFGDSARDAIVAYMEHGRPEFDKHADPHLFLSNRGRPMTRQSFWMKIVQVRAAGRDHGAHLAARAAPFLRHAPARERRRPPQRADDARPLRHLDDADLHARLAGAAAEDVRAVPPAGMKSNCNNIVPS